MQQQQQQSRAWRSAGIAGIIFGLVGFYEPAKDIYAKFFDPDYIEVVNSTIAQQQQRLAQKNLLCAISMNRKAVEADNETSLRYGVCGNNDVLVEVYPANKPAFSQWLSPENIIGAQPKTSGLFSAAYAAALMPAQAPATEPMSRPAQMTLKTVCQGWQDPARQTKMVRVTDEGGICYRERINVLSGRVEVREQVPCDTKCQ